ncbi:hypothetical protein [Legionella sp. km535]|uniref:hypothetical protein n=1 Tax=Legionella sp. km535 TaxID=2498107 RepID=UPI0013155988|nr:hypothetical protein [Legionella sp. km535]
MLEINKRKQSFLVGLLVFLCSWMIIGTGQAEMPLWTFEPLTATTAGVAWE